jgi:hypothetical protein
MSERKLFTPSRQVERPLPRWKQLAYRLAKGHLHVPEEPFALFTQIDRDYPNLTFREFWLALAMLRRAYELREEKKCLARH